MKRVSLLIIIFIWLLCAANQCNRNKEQCHNTIPFINNSDKTLYVSSKTNPPFDTIFRMDSYITVPESRYKVLPYSVSTTSVSMRPRNCYETFPKIIIFILDEQVVLTKPQYLIEEDYMILQRYDLTLEDLKILNWVVPYPPTEAMKDMKMYPAYGQ